MEGIWKWIAITTVAFLIGGGVSSLIGTAAVNRLEEELHDEIEDVETQVEDLDRVQVEIQKSLIRIETKLEAVLEAEHERHHPE